MPYISSDSEGCMKIADIDKSVMSMLAQTPFASESELAALGALPAGALHSRLPELANSSAVAYVKHSQSATSRVRRYYLQPAGIMQVAQNQACGPEDVLHRLPVSSQWQRRLVRRLDAVAALYRIGVELAAGCDAPISWHWYRAGALDALIELPDGKRFCLLRLGPTLSWKAIRSRIGTLHTMQNEMECPPALVLTPGDITAQRIAEDVRTRAMEIYLASEADVLATGHGAAVWRTRRVAGGLSLPQILDDAERGGRLPVSGTGERKGVMPNADGGGVDGSDVISTELTVAARDLLLTIFDWPLMTAEQLAGIVGVKTESLKQPRALLRRLGLLCQIRTGKTAALRQQNGTRFCLSADGLRYLARVDRRRLSELTHHWLVSPDEDGDSTFHIPGQRLGGTKLKVLMRELSHTDAVSEFVALLAEAFRRNDSWELIDLLPPHRWERWFRYNRKLRSIRPDGIFEVAHRGRRRTFLLEYEARADVPARMREKLERYRSYYGSFDTDFDFDGRGSTVLFIFAEAATASRFALFARNMARRPMPILVSSMDVLREHGVIGTAWRSPWAMQRGLLSLSMSE